MDLKETAAVADVSPKVIRHCLAAEVVKPGRRSGHWRFSENDALFFAVRMAIPFSIDIEDQKALYKIVAVGATGTGGWKRLNAHTLELLKVPHRGTTPNPDRPGIRVVVDFKGIAQALRRRLNILATSGERVVSRPELLGGEPVFAGTRIPVTQVGRLLQRGVPLPELKEDFPRLKDEDFELARLLVTIGRGPGRPSRARPLRFKREAPRTRTRSSRHRRPGAPAR